MDFDPPGPGPRDTAPEDPGFEPPGTVAEVPVDVDSPYQSQSEDSDRYDDYIEDFPNAGEPTGKTKRTPFEKIRKTQRKLEEEVWGPFKNEEEWDLARWLITSNVSQTKMDEFLKLPIVCGITVDED